MKFRDGKRRIGRALLRAGLGPNARGAGPNEPPGIRIRSPRWDYEGIAHGMVRMLMAMRPGAIAGIVSGPHGCRRAGEMVVLDIERNGKKGSAMNPNRDGIRKEKSR